MSDTTPAADEEVPVDDREPLIVTDGTRHAVVDVEGLVLNVIVAPADFDPGDDSLHLVPLEEGLPVEPGDVVERDGRVLKAPPVERPLSLEERVAALEAKANQ